MKKLMFFANIMKKKDSEFDEREAVILISYLCLLIVVLFVALCTSSSA